MTLRQRHPVVPLVFSKGIEWTINSLKTRTSGYDTRKYHKKTLHIISARFLKPLGVPTKDQYHVFQNATRPESYEVVLLHPLSSIILPYHRHSPQVHTPNLPKIHHSSKLTCLSEDSFPHTSSKTSRSLSCKLTHCQTPS